MIGKIKSIVPVIACAAAMPLYGANLVANGGFETNDVVDDAFSPGAVANQASVTLTDWTVNDTVTNDTSNVSAFDGLFYVANAITGGVDPATTAAFEGTQYVAFNSFQGPGTGSISQDLATAVGVEYIVEFSIAGAFGAQHSIIVDAGGINSLTQNATNGEWTTHSFNFVATGTTTTLTLSDNLGAGSTTDSDLLVDNISVTAVPEPGSMALLGLGGLLLARRRRAK